MSGCITQRTELQALVDDLLHACLGAPEDSVDEPFEAGRKALTRLPLSPVDRGWLDGELLRLSAHFDIG